MAKVILIDNMGRDEIADKLLQDQITYAKAAVLANEYNREHGSNALYYAKAVDNDYCLSHGIEDLV